VTLPVSANPRKIKACPEIPLGSKISVLKPGMKIVSNNVHQSTQNKTGNYVILFSSMGTYLSSYF
jgi:hypothetical protein